MMNFQEAERAYQDLRAQYSAGKLNNSDFEAQVSKLKVQDAEGRWWQIGVQSGEWYVHDGQKWSKGRPPVQAAPAAQPPAPPEAPTAAAAATGAAVGAGLAGAAAASAPPPKPAKAVVTPRLFSAAPAGRGGLPTPALIGIIALVAVIGLGVIIAAFLFLSGQLGGTATTPTRVPTVIAVVPTTSLPTIPPPPATNTLAPVPTLAPIVITATAAITPTRALTTTAATPTRALTTTAAVTTTRAVTGTAPTATRRPAGTPTAVAVATAKPVATTPNVAPGVYVLKVQTDPGVVNPNDQVGFRVTLLNTTGSVQTYKWFVKIFQCSQNPCVADDFRRSIGESTAVTSNILVGTADIVAPRHWSTGLGACTYVAIPYYFDPVSQQAIAFPQTNGQPIYSLFSLCH